jgi:hypothetical protein
MIKNIAFRLTGETPLLLHNGLLADPLYKYSVLMKEITRKRKKTEADLKALSKLEFLGGLHLKNGKPCIPGEMIEAALLKAAKLSKRGRDATRAIVVPDSSLIEYEGEHDPAKMAEMPEYFFVAIVRVGQSKVVRTRPIFKEWAIVCTVQYDDNVFNEKDIIDLMQSAGSDIGFGDWRPKYGRFSAMVEVAKGKMAA